MPPDSARPANVQTLIEQAEAEVRRQAQARPAPSPSRPRIGVWGAGLAWLVAAAVWGWQLGLPAWRQADLDAELQHLVGEARSRVDAYAEAQGKLPAQLPDAALALVVAYRAPDLLDPKMAYSLEGRIGDTTVRWQGVAGQGPRP